MHYLTKITLTILSDMTVKVWDVDALVTSTDHTAEFLLATLPDHSKSVNVVRWSRDGRFLASGSDDCYVLVYDLDKDAPPTSHPFGSTAPKNRVCDTDIICCCTVFVLIQAPIIRFCSLRRTGVAALLSTDTPWTSWTSTGVHADP